MRLSDARVGQPVRIEKFGDGSDELRRHLGDLGIRTGEVVEIKSKAFVIDLFMDKYQREDFLFPYSPNYSFLSTLFGHYDKLYSLGYDLNDIEDLAFANFFYSNLKEKPKKVEFLDVDIDNVFVLR